MLEVTTDEKANTIIYVVEQWESSHVVISSKMARILSSGSPSRME